MTFYKEGKELDQLKTTANFVRHDIIRMLAESGSGHSAAPGIENSAGPLGKIPC